MSHDAGVPNGTSNIPKRHNLYHPIIGSLIMSETHDTKNQYGNEKGHTERGSRDIGQAAQNAAIAAAAAAAAAAAKDGQSDK
jgi:hypothetical protein